MPKVIFVLHRVANLSREQMNEQWRGAQHTAKLDQLPGLTRWVQNTVVGAPGEPICDGIGELWFESDEALERGLNSPEMGAPVEDAKRFLDMDRTGLLIVREHEVAR
jgi:uncharacterized protein (TIGR02118 family)